MDTHKVINHTAQRAGTTTPHRSFVTTGNWLVQCRTLGLKGGLHMVLQNLP